MISDENHAAVGESNAALTFISRLCRKLPSFYYRIIIFGGHADTPSLLAQASRSAKRCVRLIRLCIAQGQALGACATLYVGKSTSSVDYRPAASKMYAIVMF